MKPHEGLDVVHEKSDAEPRAVVRVVAALLAATVLVALAIIWLTWGLAAGEKAADPPRPALAQQPGRLPPEPRLQTEPFADIEAQLAEERELLTSYGWVDEKAGVARIPIERAIELLLERGLPVAGEPAPPEPGGRP